VRVALVTGIYPKPSETFVVGHISSMIAMGHCVTVVAGDLKADPLPETGAEHFDLQAKIEPYRTRTFARHKLLMKWWGPLQKAKLKGLSREEKLRAAVLCDKWKDSPPDVVYAHFATNGIMAAATCKRLGIPLVVNFHGFDFTSYPLKHGWWRFLAC
jgi:glycosyltransferase involved in cell wall biosynthesis